jgi:hypothetical protein
MKKPPSGGCESSKPLTAARRLIVANPRQTKLDRFAKYTIRYAYGDEVKTVHDFGKKSKISDEFAKAKNAMMFFGSEGLGVTRNLRAGFGLCQPVEGNRSCWQRQQRFDRRVAESQ